MNTPHLAGDTTQRRQLDKTVLPSAVSEQALTSQLETALP